LDLLLESDDQFAFGGDEGLLGFDFGLLQSTKSFLNIL